MKPFLSIIFVLITATNLMAGVPQVPDKIYFANLELHLNRQAKQKIQNTVNELRKSEVYFQVYVSKANLYFPLVEKIFKEEGFPEDFKYLLIQESAFRSDAVSSSNAVGYWQFKEGSGKEVGLVINRHVDERKNIAASSRGAAKYMTKNNRKLNNWIYALLSYNTGLGGVQSHVDQKNIGRTKMYITGRMHWYVLKFLAHKIAFENEIYRTDTYQQLVVDTSHPGKKLHQVAKEYQISEDELKMYNTWLKGHKIPEDKPYEVIVPVLKDQLIAATNNEEAEEEVIVKESEEVEEAAWVDEKIKEKQVIVQAVDRPQKTQKKDIDYTQFTKNKKVVINGVKGVTAKFGDNSQKLALLGEISKKKFLRFNDLRSFDEVIPGEVYFFKRKKNKSKAAFHIVKPGESLWEISQEHAIKEWGIRSKNRMDGTESLVPGRKLWLNKYRPSNVEVEYLPVDTETVEVEDITQVKSETSPFKERVEAKKETYYTVKKGDTLYSISKSTGLSVEEIIQLNQMVNTNLSIGQKLKIK